MAPGILQSESPTLVPATLPQQKLKQEKNASTKATEDLYGNYFPDNPETLKNQIKNFLPHEPVLECRQAYFDHMSPSGLLKPGSKPVNGTFSGKDPRKYLPSGNLRRLFGLEDDAESDKYAELMVSAHEADFYVNFCKFPELRAFVSRFTGWPSPHMLQRTMLRAFVPNSELTPVHFDQMYLRAGPPTSLTAWVPIGPVSREGGGLMYLEGSTDIGMNTEDDFAAHANNLSDEERVSAFNKNMNDGGFLSRDTVSYGKETKRKRLIAEYETGDVIFHNHYMVHASYKDKDPESRIRLATDLRFVDPEKTYDRRWMKKIVRNEATRNDPPEIYNARVILISLMACGGALLFGMDMGIIGGVLTMDTFKKQYGLENQPETVLANLESNIVSVIQVGAFAGALFSTWLANRVSRRFSLIIASLLVSIGAALQAAASGHIEAMYVGRLIAGIAIGIASPVNPLYVSENAPRGIRGLLTGLYQLSIVTGLTILISLYSGSTMAPSSTSRATHSTSFHYHCKQFPAVILFIGMLLANESPRFLAHRSPDKALAVLAKLRHLPADHPYIQQEMEGISRQLEEERALSLNANHFTLLKEALTIKSYRRRSMLCITLMIPRIFASVGLTGSSTGLFATGVYSIVKTIACTVFIVFVTDSLGRRKSLLWTGIVQGIALFYVGFYIRFDPPITGEPVTAPGYVTLVAIYIFAATYQFGWGPVVWIYSSEIPPARLRAVMMGMAIASQWLFNFVVAKATPSMFATLGEGGFGTYFVYGTFCFIMVVFAWFFVPETAGLALEKMDELFREGFVERQAYLEKETPDELER
ncbi:hypothetical protein CSAL01_00763 [Colletotrichum salicis]|uniref:Major facilitator superfamily (MFS) profile domain-containing protein n=1 Tax=Colletotrichum salicis TaxID=1209931 RepID=A0A135RV87_9PEZI|nr:hypothetical protein CSAL01_00763 [Colletotrichum salicis]